MKLRNSQHNLTLWVARTVEWEEEKPVTTPSPSGQPADTPLPQFVERFAALLTDMGMPRMPSRVFSAVLAADSGRLTAPELAERLNASPAAISGAVRYLVQVGLANREHEPGSRRDHYQVDDDVWYEAFGTRDAQLERCEQRLREGAEELGTHTAAGARIAESAAFFEFMRGELAGMTERWREFKATRRDPMRVPPARDGQR